MNSEIAFYDTQVARKLRDFAYCNPRVERGWQTITEWAGRPSRILELGCGVGSISWRMSRRFKNAEIVGVDFSPESIATAKRVFSGRNLKFVLTSGTEQFDFGAFDLIVLMDVYEHVPVSQRKALHANIKRSLTQAGRLLLTFPTPRHLAWQRANDPQEIQPVDEQISPRLLCELAHDIDREILMYQDVNIWRFGDYAHAVVGGSAFPETASRSTHSRLALARLRENVAHLSRVALVARAGLKL